MLFIVYYWGRGSGVCSRRGRLCCFMGAGIMEKGEVIKQTRQHLNGIKPDKIRAIRQDIEELKLLLNLPSGAKISRVDKVGGINPHYSATSGEVIKRDNIRQDIKDKEKRLNSILQEREKVEHTIRDLFYMHYVEWGLVLLDKYLEGETVNAIAKRQRCSVATINTWDKYGLLSLANILFNNPADGEYYDEMGRYIPLTPKQRNDDNGAARVPNGDILEIVKDSSPKTLYRAAMCIYNQIPASITTSEKETFINAKCRGLTPYEKITIMDIIDYMEKSHGAAV